MKIAIIGATGFVGGHLLNHLLESNEVKVLARNPEKITIDHLNLTVVKADLLKKETLIGTLENIDVIYYLVHAMKEVKDFSFKEEEQAKNFIAELKKGQRVVYLSGLGQEQEEEELSIHLKSRQKVGDILRSSKARVIEFRASIVIGEGSLSFEMIRAIVERFPVILEANFSKSLCQPIALQDLMIYLLEAKDIQLSKSIIVEIGGAEIVPYLTLLDRYARLRDLKRPHLVIADFPPGLAEPFMKVFLPEFQEVGRKLLSSIENPTIVTNNSAAVFSLSKENMTSIDQAMEMAMKEASKWETLSMPELFSYAEKEQLLCDTEAPLIKDEWAILLPLKKSWLERVLKHEQVIKHFKVKGQVSILEMNLKEEKEKTLVTIKFLFRPQGFIDASTFIFWQNLQSTFLNRYKIPGIFHKSP
ncbi:MAG: NAD(P)H-binding protein [Bacteriovoracaceae bacterium]